MTIFYELHIRPMFRLIDRDHMLGFGFNLHEYQDVVDHQDDILALLRAGTMPPKSAGGPWPDFWIGLFMRWIDAGSPQVSEVEDATYKLAKDGATLSLTASGTLPNNGDVVWFERVNDNSPREYTLYRIPGDDGNPKPFNAKEKNIPATETQVIVWVGKTKTVVPLT
jgi:hypothetical protein